MRVAVRGSSAK